MGYRLTGRMAQRMKRDLSDYHRLFSGTRCKGWQLEELLVAAINSDTGSDHHATWVENGQSKGYDFKVRWNPPGKERITTPIQVKSGKFFKKGKQDVEFNGFSLNRFRGDLEQITDYINDNNNDIISVPYYYIDSDQGRKHIYQLCYIDSEVVSDVVKDKWEKREHQTLGHVTQWNQVSRNGTLHQLRPTADWKVWWKIPQENIHFGQVLEI